MRAGLMLVVVLGCGTLAAGEEWVPGLVGEYFRIGEELMDLPMIAAERKPNVRKVDRVVNVSQTDDGFNGTDLTEQFYVRWTGALKIEKDGEYVFVLESDDGSRLLIDGKSVVDHGGGHGFSEKEGRVELKAGIHVLLLEFYENGGAAGCVLKWQPPGGKKAVIPAEALVHKRGEDK